MKWHRSEDSVGKNNFLKICFLLLQNFLSDSSFRLPSPTVRLVSVKNTHFFGSRTKTAATVGSSAEGNERWGKGGGKGLSCVLSDLDLSPGSTIY